MYRKLLCSLGLSEKHRAPELLLKDGVWQRLNIKTVIHVGAHHAQELEFYDAMGASAVLWIEASPTEFSGLTARLRQATGKTRHVAVNAFAGETTGQTLSLRRFSNEGMSSSIFPPTSLFRENWPHTEETGTTEDVVTARLDDIASENGFSEADLLVVDVQGAELIVLRGAEMLLAQAKAVISEVSKQEFYEGGVQQPVLRQFLRMHGFEQVTRPPKHGDQLFLRK